MKTSHIGLLVLAALLAVGGLSFWASAGGASQYVTFADAKETGEEVHVVGEWVMQDMSSYDNSRDLFTFYLRDSAQNVSLVHYYDPMPVNFKQAKKVVVQGKHDGQAFVADKIFMKCPSKYNADELIIEEAEASL